MCGFALSHRKPTVGRAGMFSGIVESRDPQITFHEVCNTAMSEWKHPAKF